MSNESNRTENDVLSGPTGKTDKPVMHKNLYVQTYPDAEGNAEKCDKMRSILEFGIQRMNDKPAIGVSDYARISVEAIEQIKAVLEPNDSPDDPKPETYFIPCPQILMDSFAKWDAFLKTADPDILRAVERTGYWTADTIKPLQDYIKEAGGCAISVLVEKYLRALTLGEFLESALHAAGNDIAQGTKGDCPF